MKSHPNTDQHDIDNNKMKRNLDWDITLRFFR